MESHLESFLDAQEDVGKHHSEGVFTLDPARAWTKLAAFSLPMNEGWVLKLLQVAGALRCSLKVQQSTSETIFTWEARLNWTHSDLERAIFDVDAVSERAVTHLAAAVRVLVAQDDAVFSLRYVGGQRAC